MAPHVERYFEPDCIAQFPHSPCCEIASRLGLNCLLDCRVHSPTFQVNPEARVYTVVSWMPRYLAKLSLRVCRICVTRRNRHKLVNLPKTVLLPLTDYSYRMQSFIHIGVYPPKPTLRRHIHAAASTTVRNRIRKREEKGGIACRLPHAAAHLTRQSPAALREDRNRKR